MYEIKNIDYSFLEIVESKYISSSELMIFVRYKGENGFIFFNRAFIVDVYNSYDRKEDIYFIKRYENYIFLDSLFTIKYCENRGDFNPYLIIILDENKDVFRRYSISKL